MRCRLPPVISRVIADLESYLDGALFNRSTRQVQLTDFSEQFCCKYKPCYSKASSFPPFPGNKDATTNPHPNATSPSA
ncbi:helix-turn-helix domain-containing protein [Neisseria sicca]|uniref:helix-turn-helix domain-containing protein n=1 Tax=Neisseria sicca TaxID=490 RepID=UPI0019011D0C